MGVPSLAITLGASRKAAAQKVAIISAKRMICLVFTRLVRRAVWGGSVIHRSGSDGFTFMRITLVVPNGFRHGVKTYFLIPLDFPEGHSPPVGFHPMAERGKRSYDRSKTGCSGGILPSP